MHVNIQIQFQIVKIQTFQGRVYTKKKLELERESCDSTIVKFIYIH